MAVTLGEGHIGFKGKVIKSCDEEILRQVNKSSPLTERTARLWQAQDVLRTVLDIKLVH